jgi:RNA polymerase sigma-70 factor (ECF subfamily)
VPPTDPSLLRAARAHDLTAWDRLLKAHQLPLYTYIAELIRDNTTALDVVQETFASAVRHLASLRDDARFTSWLFGIAHQKCAQHFRRKRRTDDRFVENAPSSTSASDSCSADAHATPEDLAVDPTDDPLAQLLQREDAEALFALVEKLPAPQRSVLLLHILEEFSLEEIARITAAPLGTVKSRLHHAKRALRQLLAAPPATSSATPTTQTTAS